MQKCRCVDSKCLRMDGALYLNAIRTDNIWGRVSDKWSGKNLKRSPIIIHEQQFLLFQNSSEKTRAYLVDWAEIRTKSKKWGNV